MATNEGRAQQNNQSRIQRGHSGDYMIKKLKTTENRELRFPNRLIVDDGGNDPSIAQVHPSKLDALEIFSDDTILVRGRFRRETHLIVQGDESCDPSRIRLHKCARKNCNVNLGDIVSLHRAELKQAKRVRLVPFDSDIQSLPKEIDLFTIYLKPFFADKIRPLSQNDCIILEPSDTTFPPVEFQAVLMDPPEAGLVQRGTELFADGTPANRERDEAARRDLVGYSDLGGIQSQLGQIRELIELPLRHPALFERVGIRPPRGVLLHGPPGCGKTSIGRAIANETGAFFLVINGPEIMSAMAGEAEKNLRQAFETAGAEAATRGCAIIFIDEIDVIGGNREGSRGEVERRVVSQLLTLMDGVAPRANILVLAATNRPNALDPSLRRFGRFDREIALGVPDAQGRLDILRLKTARVRMGTDVDLEWLADNTQGFVGADIGQLVTEAAMLCVREAASELDYESKDLPDGLLEKMSVDMRHFREALRACNPSTLRETHVEVPKTTWADIGGLQDVKKTLRELIQFPIQYAEQYERLGIEPSHGCLFFGPPGNGKTLLAKAIANECQTNFISVKGPELMSMWVGESERGVRQVFDKARQAQPCVLFLDELDSIAKHRGGTGGGGEGVGDRMLNQLLTEIDGVGAKKAVFVIGATNRPDTLDPALIRGGRLDQMIYIGTPDYEARVSVLRAALRKSRVSPDVDLAQIAAVTEGYSGADLAEICQKAVQMSVRDGVERFNRQMTLLDVERTKAERAGKPLDPEYIAQKQQAAEEEFSAGVLTRGTFERAVRQSRQSVSDADVKKYEAFRQQFCDAAQGGYASNPRVADFTFKDDFQPPVQSQGMTGVGINGGVGHGPALGAPSSDAPSKRVPPKKDDDYF